MSGIKQCQIYDKDNRKFHSGLILQDGSVICGCCGSVIKKDNVGPENDKDYVIIDIFEDWANIDESILN